MENNFTLVIDSIPDNSNKKDVFYLNPENFHLAQCLADNFFENAQISNTSTELLISNNLFNVYKSLKPTKSCEILLYQPISAMQELDVKQIESNARIAGFNQIDIRTVEKRENGKSVKNVKITLTKPASKSFDEQNPPKITKTSNSNTSSTITTTSNKRGVKY